MTPQKSAGKCLFVATGSYVPVVIKHPYMAAGFDEMVDRDPVSSSSSSKAPPVLVATEYPLRSGVRCSLCSRSCSSVVIGFTINVQHAGSAAAALEAATLSVSDAAAASVSPPSTMLHSSSPSALAASTASLASAAASGRALTLLMVPCGHTTPLHSSTRDVLRAMQADPTMDMRVGWRHPLEASARCGLCQARLTHMIGCIDWSLE